MPIETAPDPQDAFQDPTQDPGRDQQAPSESSKVDADSAEERLEERAATPALEEDEDSLAKPENS
ncbi:hypothetical protein IWX75_000698 [Arthrobacter sp. CAN_A6]